MSAWILNNISPPLLLFALSVVIGGGAVLIQWYLRRRFPSLREGTHNHVTIFGFTVIALVYAFFIGFLVNAMWGKTNGTDVKVASEGSAGMQLAKSSAMFDSADGNRIRQSLFDYERAAVAEWPIAANGGTYPEADKALQRLYATYQQVQPRNDTEQKFLILALGNLDKMSAQRTERVTEAQTETGPPWSLWAVIFLTSAMVMGCTIIYGGGNDAMHYTMAAIVGVLVASNLFLIVEISHPYIGEMATSPKPLQGVIDYLSASRA